MGGEDGTQVATVFWKITDGKGYFPSFF